MAGCTKAACFWHPIPLYVRGSVLCAFRQLHSLTILLSIYILYIYKVTDPDYNPLRLQHICLKKYEVNAHCVYNNDFFPHPHFRNGQVVHIRCYSASGFGGMVEEVRSNLRLSKPPVLNVLAAT